MQRKIFLYIHAFILLNCSLFGQQLCVGPKITDVLGNEDVMIDCNYPLNGKCLQLKTTVPEFRETNSYTVSSETFSPYGAFNAGTPLLAEGDDLFIDQLNIPFNFCFFGFNYDDVIIGTNGVISFNTAQLGNINYPNIEDLNPNSSLPKSSIFGAFSDMVFSKNDDSEIYYSITGTAPCRKLIINFYKGRLVGCNQTSTSQIVLSEGSNEIEVFVENKPLQCSTAKFKNSLIGIINDDRTIGYSPNNRNTGIWEAQNEAWKFAPSGSVIIPEISWFDSTNKKVGSGETIAVCPEKNEVYTAKLKYQMCGNWDYTLEDSINVNFAADYPLAKDFTALFCGNTSTAVDLNQYRDHLTPQNAANLKFSFHNSLADAQSGANSQPTTFLLTSNKTFYVRVQNANDSSCYRTSVLNLKLIANSLLTNNIEICDMNNDGVENNYQLSALNSKLFAASPGDIVHYFLSANDAANNRNEVTSATIISTTQLFVRYETASCSEIFGPITVTFLSSPVVNTPIDYVVSLCDFKYDLTEPYDYLLAIGPLITSETGVVLSFYRSYQQALSGAGGGITDIIEGNYSVFVRVQFPGGCYSIATVNMKVTFTKVVAVDKTVYLCFDGTQDIPVDLNDYAPSMLQQSPIGITTKFFKSSSDATSNKNPISNLQTITGDGSFVTKSFYVRFEDPTGCYAVKEIEINLVHVIINQSQFQICDFENDGAEKVILSTLSNFIKGPQNAKVSYFLTDANAQANTNPITTYDIQASAKIFVRIESFGCSNVFEIELNLVSTPVIKTIVVAVANSICDNNNDGQEAFDLTSLQNEIFSGSDAVIFQYYTSYNAASNSLSGLIANPASYITSQRRTVYAKVSFKDSGCYSVSTINITLNFLPVIILKPAVLQKCDYSFNLNESFDVGDATSQLFLQNENSIQLSDVVITYYLSENDANAGEVSTQISSPVIAAKSSVIIWARFTSKNTLCYSVTSIELKTYFPPKGLNSTISDICDSNLDGLYEVDLTKYTAGMIFSQSPDNKFMFFLTKANADANSNAIENPSSFTFDSSITKIWVRVENIPGCFDTASVELKLGNKVKLDNLGPFTVTNTCDNENDGIENIDLTQFETLIYRGQANFEYYPSLSDLNNASNRILAPKTFLYNENAGSQKIFVRILASGFCPEKVEINLALKKVPLFYLDDYYFCKENYLDIKPDFSTLDIKSFEWIGPDGKLRSTTNQLLKVNIPGVYKINVVGQNDCPFSTTFKVKTFEVPVITELVASGNTITVIATGSQKILYSKDGINFGANNVFSNLPVGKTIFYVKFEGSDCRPESKEGLILDIKNAFTPNADGYNDTWVIDDLNVFDGRTANLKVFNRYQVKIFEQNSATRFVWDGETSARVVNTDSYWYVITLPDGRTFTGWVLLKNRN